MPSYLYRCPEHGVFEQFGKLNDDLSYCLCGQLARRCPFSGIPYLKGETVTKDIPDRAERWYKAEQEHRAGGWDFDRAVRHLRSNVVEDREGRKSVDLMQAGTA